jgi:hypothetical protein
MEAIDQPFGEGHAIAQTPSSRRVVYGSRHTRHVAFRIAGLHVAWRSLAEPAVSAYGRSPLRNGGLERCRRVSARADRRAVAAIRPAALARVQGKKKRGRSRADKGLEIFFVNEKVCFEKQ